MTGILVVVTLLAGAATWAHGGEDGKETRMVLQEQALSNAPGKKAIMLTVSYAPGQRSLPHQHPGAVMAYVLEGEVISQIKGQEQKNYKVGEYWFEPAGTVHLMSRNASETQPAKLLVWSLTDDKDPLAVPYKE
ncbi:cupin domain-containing protein [Pseudomonas akapageensis]|uniref:cupin domain-containing protein n=1 Tax=Pseudomonas akapageensis TaxID=2609961 RepID=UPI001407763D|nr:cupin domain-containing protein [Pseudomonas akapageensis]